MTNSAYPAPPERVWMLPTGDARGIGGNGMRMLPRPCRSGARTVSRRGRTDSHRTGNWQRVRAGP